MTCPCLHFDAADPDVQRFGLGAAALRYQHQGYAVLPLTRGGKRPHRMLPYEGKGRDGVYHGSHEPMFTQGWWSQDKAANVGVATGQVSQLAVIDLDVKKVNGIENFTRFLLDYGITCPLGAACVQTPSGGWHIWLRTSAGAAVPDRPSILPGVDVKGDGGLVVVPPSMLLTVAAERPGEPRGGAEAPVPYSWVSGCPHTVPDAPAWVLPWLLSAPPSGSPGHGESGESPDLASLKRTGIPRGQRNAELYRLACSLFRQRGTTIEASVSVKEDLMEVWAAGDRSGFTPSELLTIIDSARRFVAGQMEEETARNQRYIEWMDRGRRST